MNLLVYEVYTKESENKRKEPCLRTLKIKDEFANKVIKIVLREVFGENVGLDFRKGMAAI